MSDLAALRSENARLRLALRYAIGVLRDAVRDTNRLNTTLGKLEALLDAPRTIDREATP